MQREKTLICQRCSQPFQKFCVNENGQMGSLNQMELQEYIEIYGAICFECLDSQEKKEMQVLCSAFGHQEGFEILNDFAILNPFEE
jgi:hypothetical protein